MIVEVWLGIVVPAQGVHNEETALCTILLQDQAPLFEYLEAQGWRGSVQGDHIHRPVQRFVQNGANLHRAGEHVCRGQLSREKHGHIHVAQGMGLLPGCGAEQVDGHQIRGVVQGYSDPLLKIRFVTHLTSHCIPSLPSRQAREITDRSLDSNILKNSFPEDPHLLQLAHGTLEEFPGPVDDRLRGQRGQQQAQDAVGHLQSLDAEVTRLDQFQ